MNHPAPSGGMNNLKPPASIGRAQWLALLAAFLGWMFDGVELGLFPLVARPALKELMGPAATEHMGTWLSAITAAFLVGAAIGGLAFGWLGDRIGRVRAMAWSVLVYSLFSGLSPLPRRRGNWPSCVSSARWAWGANGRWAWPW